MAEKIRQPIVVVLGHVDHGKTSLLDKIRQTNIAAREVGGITQSIGASVITTPEGKKITFIDTPGHAAFGQMRSRGAQVADLAILVVAADAGIKPQTREALEHIRQAKIPFLVALTKIDLETANPEAVVGQLEKEGLLFEGRGGQIPKAAVSAKTGQGVKELLELLSLLAEVSEIKADPEADLEAVVIETGKDKRGCTVSLVIRNGRLEVGDQITGNHLSAKVRGLFDFQGRSVKKTLPGEPALILGFSQLPEVGTKIEFSKGPGTVQKKDQSSTTSQVIGVEEDKLPLVIKAANAGGLEAVLQGLPQEVTVVCSGVGDLTESDVFVAKSAEPAARILVFESKVPKAVANLADTEGVAIEEFKIIYKLFEKAEELVREGQRKILGKAQIVASFPFDGKRVAGCRMISGEIKKKGWLVLSRGEKDLGQTRAVSIKKQKDEVDLVKEGEEFGVLFKPQLDFEKGDMILSVAK